MSWLATWLASHRRTTAAVVVAVSLVALVGVTRLRFDDDPRRLFRTRDTAFDELEQISAEFGADDAACLVVIEADDVFTPAAMEVVRSVVDEARRIPHVGGVHSLLDGRRPGAGRTQLPLVPKLGSSAEAFARAKQHALRNPLVVGQLLSRDARLTVVVVQMEGSNPEFSTTGQVTDRLRAILRDAKTPGVRLRLTGVPAIRAEIERHVQGDLVKFNSLGALLAGAIALVMFRTWSSVVLVLVAPVLGSLWITGAMGWIGMPVNVINGVVPTLVLVIGLTDSVHFLVDIRHSRGEQQSRRLAALTSIEHVGTASGLTSLTTAVGFASLAVARLEIIRDFGLICALGSVLTFLAVVSTVPLLATTRLGDHLTPPQPLADERRTRWSDRLAGWSMRHAGAISVGAVLAAILLANVARGLTPNCWIVEDLPRGAESGAALADCDRLLGGVTATHAVVEWPAAESYRAPAVLQVLAEVHRAMGEQPPLAHPVSLLSLLATLPEASKGLEMAARYLDRAPAEVVRRFVNEERRHLLVSVRTPDRGAIKMNPVFDALSEKLAEIERAHPGYRVRLVGSQVAASRNVPRMISDLGSSIGLESLIIFGMMAWAFRSLSLGLISVLPNVFPLVTVAALIVLLGWPLQIGSVIVFNICLGLAVDDTIHVMTRFKRELGRTHDVHAAVHESFLAIGPAMFTTSAILLAGFCVVMLSRVHALRLFGFLSAVTIVTALVAELVLLPALLTTFLRFRGERMRQLHGGEAGEAI